MVAASSAAGGRADLEAPLSACAELLESEVHEHRFVSLAIMRHQFERGRAEERDRISGLYLDKRAAVNNWDLVDASASYLLADRVRQAPRKLNDPLLDSSTVWDRRMAVLATAMPRTALRYAIERLSKDERRRWMQAG